MRFLIILTLGLLCLVACDSDTNTTVFSPVEAVEIVPSIHIHNATGTTHRVEVDYGRGFKTLKIGEGGDFQFHFRSRGNSSQGEADTYDLTIYDDGSQDIKCSSTITVGQGRCIATIPESSCAVKAGIYGPTCQIELTISE